MIQPVPGNVIQHYQQEQTPDGRNGFMEYENQQHTSTPRKQNYPLPQFAWHGEPLFSEHSYNNYSRREDSTLLYSQQSTPSTGFNILESINF